MSNPELQHAVALLRAGKIIAYPTEAVYGLGCDPFDQHAVSQLIKLKGREFTKGLILLASSWPQIEDLIAPLTEEQLETVRATWPGPITWVFPASSQAPKWVTGERTTIAIRMTKHPIAKELCDLYGQPLVSTSANPSGKPPARSPDEVMNYFNHQIDFILRGATGDLASPTTIRDVITGEILRG